MNDLKTFEYYYHDFKAILGFLNPSLFVWFFICLLVFFYLFFNPGWGSGSYQAD